MGDFAHYFLNLYASSHSVISLIPPWLSVTAKSMKLLQSGSIRNSILENINSLQYTEIYLIL